MSDQPPPAPSDIAPVVAVAPPVVVAALPARQVLEGIGWMALTGLLFVCVTGIVRHVGAHLPAVEAAFIRYAIGLLLMAPVLGRLLRHRPRRKTAGLYLVRGVIHGGAVMLWFYAMARIPIAEVTAIGYVSPIFITLGAALFLGEKLHLRRVGGVVAGFVGVLIIVRPGFSEISLGQLAQLGAAPLFAISFLMAKRLTAEEGSAAIVGMLSLVVTLTLLPAALLQWQPPTLAEVLWLGLTACFATAGHYTQIRAFQAAPISLTQPVGFLQLVWAMLLGMIVFGEPADPYVFLGGGVIVASVTYISHREAQAARRAVGRK